MLFGLSPDMLLHSQEYFLRSSLCITFYRDPQTYAADPRQVRKRSAGSEKFLRIADLFCKRGFADARSVQHLMQDHTRRLILILLTKFRYHPFIHQPRHLMRDAGKDDKY